MLFLHLIMCDESDLHQSSLLCGIWHLVLVLY